jgi:uncharacterized repeat protein (TIGR03803 family)
MRSLGFLILGLQGVRGDTTLITMFSFNGTNGGNPSAALLRGSDGKLYGTTQSGGVGFQNAAGTGYGTVFRLDTNGLLSTLVYFAQTNGESPRGPLTEFSKGTYYGTTERCSIAGAGGSVFRISADGTFTNLAVFSGYDGLYPAAGLVRGTDNALYGTTANGGNSLGNVFRIATNGALAQMGLLDGSNGKIPQSPLVLGSDGNFYGTAGLGGANDYGTVFKVTPSRTATALTSFNGIDGANPYGGLIQGADGYLYGTTAYGGSYSLGTVFRLATNGLLSTLVSFNGTNGSHPWAGLLVGKDGALYGSAAYGGLGFDGTSLSGNGTLFKLTSNGSLTTLISFGVTTGMRPSSELIQDQSGDFYGTTALGGSYLAYGTIFRLAMANPSAFQTIQMMNNAISLQWSATIGQAYQVQFASDIGSTNWNNLGNEVAATNVTMTTLDGTPIAPNRFYRVLAIP